MGRNGISQIKDIWNEIQRDQMAAHLGHVSNFRGLKRGPFEPFELLLDQSHWDETSRLIQPGHPGWTRSELAEAAGATSRLQRWRNW